MWSYDSYNICIIWFSSNLASPRIVAAILSRSMAEKSNWSLERFNKIKNNWEWKPMQNKGIEMLAVALVQLIDEYVRLFPIDWRELSSMRLTVAWKQVYVYTFYVRKQTNISYSVFRERADRYLYAGLPFFFLLRKWNVLKTIFFFNWLSFNACLLIRRNVHSVW